MKKTSKILSFFLVAAITFSTAPQNIAHAEDIHDAYHFDVAAHNALSKTTKPQIKSPVNDFVPQAEMNSFDSYISNECMIQNENLEFYVHPDSDSFDSGRFTIGNTGGNPNSYLDDNKKLLYGHPYPGTSYTTIRIDGSDYIFTANKTIYDHDNLTATSEMFIDDVVVTQTLQLVENSTDGVKDTVQISYSSKNTSISHKTIGIRIMLDTMLGSNDGAPFKVPSLGNVTYERELLGSDIPKFWQAYDSLTNPSIFAIGTLYKSADEKPDKLQYAYWNRIYDSASAWNYNIDTDRSITGDSAVAIYWNPKAVPPGGTKTVSTYYGVGYTEGTVDSSHSSVLIGENEYAFEVRGQNGDSLHGINVEIEGIGSAVTDSQGIAKFEVSNGEKRKITVSAPQYRTAEVQHIVKRGTSGFIVLSKDDGSPYIKSITLDDIHCLLSEGRNFKSDKQNTTNSKIVITADSKGVSNLRYRLIQGGDVIAENTTGIFNLPIQKDFKENEPIYAYLTNSNSTIESAKYLTGLKITKNPVSSGVTEFKLGGENAFSFDLPQDWPIIGGDKVEFGFGKFPIQVDVDGDKVKVAIGMTKDEWFNGGFSDDPNKDFWSDVKKEYTDILKNRISDRFDAASAFGGRPSGFGAGSIDLDMQVLGYGEGRLTSSNVFVNVGLCLKVKGEAGYTQYFFIGFVPVYAGIKGGAEIDFSSSVSANFSTETLEVTSYTFPSTTELKVSPYVQPSVGAGVQGALSLEVGGKINFPLTWKFANKFFEARADGKIYAKATAFIFHAKIEKEIFDKQLYSKYWGNTVNSFNNTADVLTREVESFDFYNSNNYQMMDRDYINKKVFSPMNFGANDITTLYSNVYPQSQPRFIKAGENQYLIWLDDGAFHSIERTDSNRTVLMYSVFSGSNWSEPQAVSEDGTGDFYFDVATDGTDVYVAWTDSNKEFDADVDLFEMVASTDISVAKINGTSVSDIKTLNNNTYCDMYPSISVNTDGEVLVSWIENFSNDLFASNSSGISSCKYDGTVWSEPTNLFSTNSKQIISMDNGIIDGDFAVAFSLDEDGDYSTKDDVKIFTLTKNNPNPSNLSGTPSHVSNPQFGFLKNQPALFWYNNGDISYVTSNSSRNVKNVFGESHSIPTDSFSIISDNVNTNILWTQGEVDANEKDVTNIFLSKYDGNIWSDSVKVAGVNAYASSLSGIINSNDRVEIAFADYNNSTETYRINNLEIIPTPDIQFIEAAFDKEAVSPEGSLPLTMLVYNKNIEPVSSLNVKISTNESVIYYDSIPVTILPGEEKEIAINDFVLPDFTSVSEYTFNVYVDGEEDLSDNEFKTPIGYSDIELTAGKYLSANQWYANITLENKTGVPTNSTLRIFADGLDGAVLYEGTTGVIESEANLVMTFDLTQLTEAAVADTLYFSVSPEKEEFYELNNTQMMVHTVTKTEASVYSINASAIPSFGDVEESYIPPAEKTVVVTNTGNASITLAQPTSLYYQLGALSNTTVAPGESVTFTVRPNEGLERGFYNETIVINGTNGANTQINLGFTVFVPMSGDVNGDLIVNTNDVIALLRYTLGNDYHFIRQNAYIDDNHVIDNRDATLILRSIATGNH